MAVRGSLLTSFTCATRGCSPRCAEAVSLRSGRAAGRPSSGLREGVPAVAPPLSGPSWSLLMPAVFQALRAAPPSGLRGRAGTIFLPPVISCGQPSHLRCSIALTPLPPLPAVSVPHGRARFEKGGCLRSGSWESSDTVPPAGPGFGVPRRGKAGSASGGPFSHPDVDFAIGLCALPFRRSRLRAGAPRWAPLWGGSP